MPIHKSAVVDRSAQIDSSASIGPFTVIGPNVTIGPDCSIGSCVWIDWTNIGANSHIGPNTVIGGNPQVYGWKPVESWLKIGSNVIIGELVVIHRSMYEGKATVIGDNCFIMAQSHMAHDCVLDRFVMVTSLSGLSGHLEIGEHAVIGGAVGIHQFVRIGAYSMIGGMTRVQKDVCPYFLVTGNPSAATGLNSYALKKHKMPLRERANLKKAYKILTMDGMTLSSALQKITDEIQMDDPVAKLVEFVRTSDRGIIL